MKKKSLIKGSYISRKFILRTVLFIAVIGAAFVFDMCRSEQFTSEDQEQAQIPMSNSADTDAFMIYSSVNTLNLKYSSSKTSIRKLYLRTQDRFLQQHHNIKIYDVLKAKMKIKQMPVILSFHFLDTIRYHFSSPDDPESLA
ncbi:hypothetical protein EYV94_12300 [Puteibacter caeruleilacunae]|nr:hypothetical protein EYV94_12300 [Puteibacter caeruleilacunae]